MWNLHKLNHQNEVWGRFKRRQKLQITYTPPLLGRKLLICSKFVNNKKYLNHGLHVLFSDQKCDE